VYATAASLSNDPDNIFEDIKKKQAKSGKKLINSHPGRDNLDGGL
jgi:hypothetical protein